MCFPVLFFEQIIWKLTETILPYRYLPERQNIIYIYITQAQKPFRNASDLQRSYHNGFLLFVKVKCMNKKIAWRICKILNSKIYPSNFGKSQNSKIPKFQESKVQSSKIPKFQNSKKNPVNFFGNSNSQFPFGIFFISKKLTGLLWNFGILEF